MPRGVSRRRAVPDPAAAIFNWRPGLFRDRGVSLDTGIFPNFSIDQALRDLKNRGVLHEGQVARVAVIGPGLDFSDKNENTSYDYYPQQTLQPFALLDSLSRLGFKTPAGRLVPEPPREAMGRTLPFVRANAHVSVEDIYRLSQDAEKPAELIRRSVRGMLPKNTLGRQMLGKLQVYAGPDHPHSAQKPETLELPQARRAG